MEVELEDTFLYDDDEDDSDPNFEQDVSTVYTNTIKDEKSEAAESVAAMLIRTYEGKLGAQDYAISRQAPIISVEACKIKKHRRSEVTICLTNCIYESIRRVVSLFGMREVSKREPWNFYWTDMSVNVEAVQRGKRGKRKMNRFQRINHFPGMLQICRKNLLARNLKKMQKIYPEEYNFFPKTWCFPADLGQALIYSESHKNETFIIKPEIGCQGRGIYLTKSLKDIQPKEKLICQVYLSRPYLVDGYKFDIRIYTLITSCDPLRIFVYNEGLVRFATSRYADPNVKNATNVYMHLTNYSLNKHSRMYVSDSEVGSKRKISTLNKILVSQGIDLDRLWHSIDQVIVKTIISAWPILKHSYHACFPTHDVVQACFEILGFDILLDHKLHPYILEVNHSPSFKTDTQLDREVKEALLTDTFTMLNIWQCDKRRVLEEDRKRIRDRLLQTNKSSDSMLLDEKVEPVKNSWQKQIQWEESHLGNFRRVYPLGEQYASLFHRPSGRGDCTRQQQQESQIQFMKKSQQANKEKKAGEEAAADTATDKKERKAKPEELKKPREKDDRASTLSTVLEMPDEPDPIVEEEEWERVHLLLRHYIAAFRYNLEQI